MSKVILRGPVLSKSGYGTHCRQVFRWLLSRGHDISCEITPWGITSWHVDPLAQDGLIGEAMRRTGKDTSGSDLSLQVQLPHEWNPTLARMNVGVTAGVETDRVPANWVDVVKPMTLVIVPSTFTKEGFVKSGAPPEKIAVVPEAFSDSLLEVTRDTPGNFELSDVDTPFNFLLFGQVTSRDPETDRKNLLYTVKWFAEEFSGNKDVGLIVKSNLGTNCVFHRSQLNSLFKTLVGEVRKGAFPRIYLVNGDMSDDDCASLMCHPKVSALVSFTRGEGYGLPIIDAAAAGLPIIATGWSGHMEYLRRGKFSKVAYDLVQIPHQKMEPSIFVEGSRWAMPQEADAKKRMRKMFESPENPREWAKELQVTIQREYSFSSLCSVYDETLKGILT